MGDEHFRHPISAYRHRLGFDRRDCSSMGIIRILEVVKKPGEARYWVDVHCLQYGRDYTVRFDDDEVGHIGVYPTGHLTLFPQDDAIDVPLVEKLRWFDLRFWVEVGEVDLGFDFGGDAEGHG